MNPLRLQAELERRYRSFYDSAYALADEHLMKDRAREIDRRGLSAALLIEPVPGFRSSGLTLSSIAAELAAPDGFALFAAPLLGERELYAHQANALRAYAERRHVVVTAGTGSGKTESFLLPILWHLMHESQSWQGRGAKPEAWWERSRKPVLMRDGETGRRAAIRALVLYPMNALVEDQMVRLRRVLSAPSQLSWLDQQRGGHRFYFGRYTGQTPKEDLQQELSRMARRSARAATLS
jgi:ATP-dependent helicase YprA (DUF1998 family)